MSILNKKDFYIKEIKNAVKKEKGTIKINIEGYDIHISDESAYISTEGRNIKLNVFPDFILFKMYCKIEEKDYL